jgi:hypothetical protein
LINFLVAQELKTTSFQNTLGSRLVFDLDYQDGFFATFYHESISVFDVDTVFGEHPGNIMETPRLIFHYYGDNFLKIGRNSLGSQNFVGSLRVIDQNFDDSETVGTGDGNSSDIDRFLSKNAGNFLDSPRLILGKDGNLMGHVISSSHI